MSLKLGSQIPKYRGWKRVSKELHWWKVASPKWAPGYWSALGVARRRTLSTVVPHKNLKRNVQQQKKPNHAHGMGFWFHLPLEIPGHFSPDLRCVHVVNWSPNKKAMTMQVFFSITFQFLWIPIVTVSVLCSFLQVWYQWWFLSFDYLKHNERSFLTNGIFPQPCHPY